MSPFRGSRKHVLDWVGQSRFAEELTPMLRPTGAVVSGRDRWMPRSADDAVEARLETFGPTALPGGVDWASLRRWWLAHPAGANTPNWDIAATCAIEGKPGLVLVEAKANHWELSARGKAAPVRNRRLKDEARAQESLRRSKANHRRIAAAIAEAARGLSTIVPGVGISVSSCYQVANRVAFAWKLATLGVPTVLVYLGFVGDEGIGDARRPFTSPADWENAFWAHVQNCLPRSLAERRLEVGGTPMWLLVRSRGVLEVSPPASPRRRRTA